MMPANISIAGREVRSIRTSKSLVNSDQINAVHHASGGASGSARPCKTKSAMGTTAFLCVLRRNFLKDPTWSDTTQAFNVAFRTSGPALDRDAAASGEDGGMKHWTTVIALPATKIVAVWDPYKHDCSQSQQCSHLLRQLNAHAAEHDHCVEGWSFRVQRDGYQCGVWAALAALVVKEWCWRPGAVGLKESFLNDVAARVAAHGNDRSAANVARAFKSGETTTCADACAKFAVHERRRQNVLMKSVIDKSAPGPRLPRSPPLFEDELGAKRGESCKGKERDDDEEVLNLDVASASHSQHRSLFLEMVPRTIFGNGAKNHDLRRVLLQAWKVLAFKTRLEFRF